MSAGKSNTATETTATAEATSTPYVGRFAPSPTGALHIGSLYTAAASYLDARAQGGRWLVRMEDLDTPRVVAGASSAILRTLARFGFEWDGEVLHQSSRVARYQEALDALRHDALTFECSCSRTQLADETRYPGYCRAGPLRSGLPTATRLRVDAGTVEFTDRVQGRFRQDVAAAVGDFVLRRRDGWYAYVLGVVVDDAHQGVSHIVRGADLLDQTARQIHLQRLLGLPQPEYGHVPVITERDGAKLAKSTHSIPVDTRNPVEVLANTFTLLGLSPPAELHEAALPEAWAWAMGEWHLSRVPRRLTRALDLP